jgi:hypothetical protein
MRADNSHHVIAAARRRSEEAQQQAAIALRRLDSAGRAVSFDAVAKEARVSRSWLYTQPHLRAEIERLRQRQRSSPSRIIPDRQRASDPSLKARLTAAHERIRELQAENRRLRTALAEALGTNRVATTQAPINDLSRNSGGLPSGQPVSVEDAVHVTTSLVRGSSRSGA